MMNDIKITTDFIKLDSFLKLCGECGTGGQAKCLIQDNLISVNNEICTMRGKKLHKNDIVTVNGNTYRVI